MPSRSGSDDERDDDRTIIGEIAERPGRDRRDRAQLLALAGTSLGRMFRIDRPETIIGRASDATIHLQDDGVSRRHARIVLVDGQLCLEDLGSANGTLLNGHKIRSAVLSDNDKIQFGSATILKFMYVDELEEDFQQKMYDAALHDGLTGAFNKRHLLDRLQVEVSYAKRHGTPLSLIMLDLDHFKAVNDRYGHPAGDYVLATLADIVRQSLRTEDLFARYGGEEFAILCRGATVDSALVLAERLRAKIEVFVFEQDRGRIPVTISVGVASWFDQEESLTRLIASADAALYKAKASGRNRVVVRAVEGA